MDQDLDLAERLARQAGTVDDHPDEADLYTRIDTRARRRSRVVVGAVSAALVLGPLAGSVVLRSDGPGPANLDVATAPATPGTETGEASDDGGRLTWIGAVVTEHAEVDLYSGPTGAAPGVEGCAPSGDLVAHISTSTSDVAATVRTEWNTGTVQLIGAAEGHPTWVVVAHTGTDAATVTFPDGTSAEGAGVEGVVVAVSPVRDATAPNVVGPKTGAAVAFDGQEQWVGPGLADEDGVLGYECRRALRRSTGVPPDGPDAPEPLPAAGAQPADPAAAREQVRSAVAGAFAGEQTAETAMEHPDEVLSARTEAREKAEGIRVRATMAEVVFTSPTTATFRFDLETVPAITRFPDQIGEARLRDGRWLITTETVCVQIRRNGVTCPSPPG